MENKKDYIYKLIMTSHNPSADRKGYFITNTELLKTQAKWEKITKEDPEYYGETTFEVEKVYLGESNFD